MSPTRMSPAGCASAYPPRGPRLLVTNPARFKSWKICSKNRGGMACREAISLICVGPPSLWNAMSNMAQTP